MSSRPQFDPYPVVEDGDMSAEIISQVTIVQKLSMISNQLVWSGTGCEGEVFVEVSNDYRKNAEGGVKNAGTWRALPIDQMLVEDDAGDGAIDIYATGFYAVRLRYVPTAGTGELDATISAKVG